MGEVEGKRMWISRLIMAVCFLLGAAGLTTLGVLSLGGGGDEAIDSPYGGDDPKPVNPSDSRVAPARWPRESRWHGMAMDLHNPDMPEGFYRKYIDEIADLGCNAICFKISAYQENKHSVAIYLDVRKVLPAERLKRLVAHAHKRGLKVMLLPIVLPTDPIANEWRGQFSPGHGKKWGQWFVSYTALIHHFAKFAVANGVEMLSVGSELITAEKYTEHWRRLIRSTRGIVKDNVLLTYSSNWDHYSKIGYWDLLDVFGVTSYYTLADKGSPSVKQLKDKWVDIRKKLEAFSRAKGRPIFFTEVGWCSLDGATVEPWNYYRSTGINLEEQRAAYEAFLATWQDSPSVAGMVFWEWSTNDGGPKDRGYTPKGKPAGALLKQWLAARRAATAPATAPATTQAP